jgi:hypothetical protein
MGTFEIIGLIFGSGVLVAAINQIGNYIFSRRKRKDDVEDKAIEKEEFENTQIKELKESTDKQLKDMREDIGALSTTVNALGTIVGTVVQQTGTIMKSQKAQAYDRIRYLGLMYIKAGEIDPEDLKVLTEMYDAYQQLPGADGFLIKLMTEVNSLRIKID